MHRGNLQGPENNRGVLGGVRVFCAFFWQSFATIFGTNLRVDYDPLEDRDIEGIIYWIEHPDKFTLVR